MAASYIQSNISPDPTFVSSTTIQLAFLSAVQNGSVLIAAVTNNTDSGSTVTVSDNINGQWIAGPMYNDPPWSQKHSLFYFAHPAVGMPTVTATFSVAEMYGGLWIFEYGPCRQFSPVKDDVIANLQVNSAPGTDTIVSTSFDTTENYGVQIVSYTFDDSPNSTELLTGGTTPIVFNSRGGWTNYKCRWEDGYQSVGGPVNSTFGHVLSASRFVTLVMGIFTTAPLLQPSPMPVFRPDIL